MAEIIDNMMRETETKRYASNSKGNAALTLGIIGTALSGITMLGGIGSLLGVGGKSTTSTGGGANEPVVMSLEELYLERSQCQKYLDITKQYYEGQAQNTRELTNAFFDAYKRDVDNSFMLYKMNRDNKDELNAKIDDVSKKVDVMAAIRPYQDALIDQKINTNALIADFNLCRRTCKMIEGQLVLPSTPLITGYGSYNPFSVQSNTTTA